MRNTTHRIQRYRFLARSTASFLTSGIIRKDRMMTEIPWYPHRTWSLDTFIRFSSRSWRWSCGGSSVAVWIHIQCTHDRVCWASSVATWIYNVFNAREVIRGEKSHGVCVFLVVRLDNGRSYHYCLTILIIRPTPLTSSFYPLKLVNMKYYTSRSTLFPAVSRSNGLRGRMPLDPSANDVEYIVYSRGVRNHPSYWELYARVGRS